MNKFIKIGETIINTDNVSTCSRNRYGVLIVMNDGNTVKLDNEMYVVIKPSTPTDALKIHESKSSIEPEQLWELLLYATEPVEAKKR